MFIHLARYLLFKLTLFSIGKNGRALLNLSTRLALLKSSNPSLDVGKMYLDSAILVSLVAEEPPYNPWTKA